MAAVGVEVDFVLEDDDAVALHMREQVEEAEKMASRILHEPERASLPSAGLAASCPRMRLTWTGLEDLDDHGSNGDAGAKTTFRYQELAVEAQQEAAPTDLKDTHRRT